MESDCWYFAYGSNLLQEHLEEWSGEILEPQVCRLADYRLAFNKRKKDGTVAANIMKEDGEKVWGVIYSCSPAAMKEIDRKEGVATGDYHRESVSVVLPDGTEVAAIAYVANDDRVCAEDRPGKGYLDKIVRGARQHGLPPEYIQRIETLGNIDR